MREPSACPYCGKAMRWVWRTNLLTVMNALLWVAVATAFAFRLI